MLKEKSRGMGLIPIQSNLEGRTYALYKLEEIMKPLGYSIGGIGIMIKDASITKLMKKMGINFTSSIYSH